MRQVVLLHHGVVAGRQAQQRLVLRGLPAVVAHKVAVARLVQLDVIARADAVHHTHAADIHAFLPQGGGKMQPRAVIGQHADIGCCASVVAAGQHGHIDAVAPRVQLLPPAVIVQHVVSYAKQLHQYFSTPMYRREEIGCPIA